MVGKLNRWPDRRKRANLYPPTAPRRVGLKRIKCTPVVEYTMIPLPSDGVSIGWTPDEPGKGCNSGLTFGILSPLTSISTAAVMSPSQWCSAARARSGSNPRPVTYTQEIVAKLHIGQCNGQFHNGQSWSSIAVYGKFNPMDWGNIVRGQSDLVNEKESLLSVCDNPYHTNNVWSFAELLWKHFISWGI